MKKLLSYIKVATAVVKEVVTKVVKAVKSFVDSVVATEEKVGKITLVKVDENDQPTKEGVKVATKATKEDSLVVAISKALGYGVIFIASYILVSMFPITILYIIEMIAVMQLFLWVGEKVAA